MKFGILVIKSTFDLTTDKLLKMLKAEDLEQQREEQNIAATTAAKTVTNATTNPPNQDRGGPQSPLSYSTPAPSRFYCFQKFSAEQANVISFFSTLLTT